MTRHAAGAGAGDRGDLLAAIDPLRARRGLPRPVRGHGPRLPDRGPRRPHHRPQPDHGLPRDLRGSRLQLAVSVADGTGHDGVGARPPADAPRRDAADPLPRSPSPSRSAAASSTSAARASTGSGSSSPCSSGRTSRASPRPLHVALCILAGHPRRSLLGRHRRLPARHRRGARGDHDDHAQLDRDLRREVVIRAQRALAGRSSLASPLGDHLRLGDRSGSSGSRTCTPES